MNTTRNTYSDCRPDRRETSSQGLTLGNLIADGIRFGPAPTPAREAAAAALTFVLLGVVIFVLQPQVLVSVIAIGAAVAIFAVRLIVGTRKWATR